MHLLPIFLGRNKPKKRPFLA